MNSTFFQTQAYFNSRYDTVGRRMGFKATSQEEQLIWKHDLLGILHQLLGLDRMIPCPINPRITDEVQCDGYRRQRVEIDTEPGVTMPL